MEVAYLVLLALSIAKTSWTQLDVLIVPLIIHQPVSIVITVSLEVKLTQQIAKTNATPGSILILLTPLSMTTKTRSSYKHAQLVILHV